WLGELSEILLRLLSGSRLAGRPRREVGERARNREPWQRVSGTPLVKALGQRRTSNRGHQCSADPMRGPFAGPQMRGAVFPEQVQRGPGSLAPAHRTGICVTVSPP